MWYFAWVLGVLLAVAFGIINVMSMELHGDALEAGNNKQD